MKTASQLILTCVLIAISSYTLATPIDITYARTLVNASDTTRDGGVDEISNDVTFGSRILNAVEGESFSQINVNWSDLGDAAVLDYEFDMFRVGDYRAAARNADTIYFTATQDTTFSLSAIFEASDIGGASAFRSYVTLLDRTTDTTLFLDLTESTNTIDASFVLGDMNDGDSLNLYEGSLTGNLFTGHDYYFAFHHTTLNYPMTNQGGSASGCMTLAIGTTTNGYCGATTTVPAPFTFAVFGIGLLMVGLQRKVDRHQLA